MLIRGRDAPTRGRAASAAPTPADRVLAVLGRQTGRLSRPAGRSHCVLGLGQTMSAAQYNVARCFSRRASANGPGKRLHAQPAQHAIHPYTLPRCRDARVFERNAQGDRHLPAVLYPMRGGGRYVQGDALLQLDTVARFWYSVGERHVASRAGRRMSSSCRSTALRGRRPEHADGLAPRSAGES